MLEIFYSSEFPAAILKAIIPLAIGVKLSMKGRFVRKKLPLFVTHFSKFSNFHHKTDIIVTPWNCFHTFTSTRINELGFYFLIAQTEC